MKVRKSILGIRSAGSVLFSLFLLGVSVAYCSRPVVAPGRVVLVVEREAGSLAVVDYRRQEILHRIQLGGNLRHAAMVFDPDLRYGYLASRSGDLFRVDLATMRGAGSVQTSENSIGLAVSQDGRTVAVSEYKPGGITIIDTERFSVTQRIPARRQSDGAVSRVTGLVDGAGGSFVCALMDGQEIWELHPEHSPAKNVKTAGASEGRTGGGPVKYRVSRRITAAAESPFDALITPEGRYYLTGHFQSDVVSLVDLWSDATRASQVKFRPVDKATTPAKMPHMETWATSGGFIYVPRVGERRLSVVASEDFREVDSIPLIGHPVYAVVSPEGREIWVTFSGEEADGKIQIIDLASRRTVRTLDAGKRLYHLVFTPRGDMALASSNKTDELLFIDTKTREITGRLELKSPSGIFGVWRAFRLGL